MLLAANEDKERGKLVQTRAESKFICIMPSAAEVAQSECLSVGKAALHGVHAQRVAPFPNLPRKDNNGENKATGTQSFV